MALTDRALTATILLVEDDAGDELMAREAFADDALDSHLHVARDGEQALDFLYRRGEHVDAPRPDFILLDLNLPRVDGREVLRQIKSDAAVASIPVVVLTTSGALEDPAVRGPVETIEITRTGRGGSTRCVGAGHP
ncbi:response regulator [Dactylosporangium sp. NPDC050588]|uniref:response regulator n=1 Tax=Dactylosporangium sp. NPDC050588 TaxID=3157211 RepID=UPI0033E3C3C9